jgi:hypothetical protein
MKYLLYENGTIIITPGNRPPGRIAEALRKESVKKKTYAIGTRQKRKIQCAGIRMWHKKKNSIKFITLTFSNSVDQSEANKCLSRYLDNLKKTYDLNTYIIIKEDHKSGVPHFHCIFDIPFQHFEILNFAWCNACRRVMRFSVNALTTGERVIVEDIKQVAYYITKYIIKSQAGNNETRRYFYSRSLESKPQEISYGRYIDLINTFPVWKHIEKEFFSITFLKDFADLPEKYVNKPVEKPSIRIKKVSKSEKIPLKFPFDYGQSNVFFHARN